MASQTEKNKLSFEQSLERLESILNEMNSGDLTLENSLKVYQEANALIQQCTTELNEAEQKIEILVKNRQGEIALDQDGNPLTQPFTTNISQEQF